MADRYEAEEILNAATRGDTPDEWDLLVRDKEGWTYRGSRFFVGGWWYQNAGTGLTDQDFSFITSDFTTWVPLRDGYITGLVLRTNDARTAGTATAEVQKNGVDTGLQAILNATDTENDYETADYGAYAFSAGDEITIVITTDGSWAPTTADLITGIEVVM